MSEISAVSVDSEATKETPSYLEQARRRKQRREAKIRAGGSARLNKITGLGGVQRDHAEQFTPGKEPEKIENPSHDYESINSQIPSDEKSSAPEINAMYDKDILNQMKMHELNLISHPSNINSHSFPAGYEEISGTINTPGTEDPMMKILRQMMGGIKGERLENVNSMPDSINPKPVSGSPPVKVWRIIHAVFALSLGLYIAVTTEFTGSLLQREVPPFAYRNVIEYKSSPNLNYFYMFFTVETLLITTRHLLKREKVQLGAFEYMIMNFLNEPYSSYFQYGMQYIEIWTTISRDAMVCIFMLGAYAWWNDLGA